MAAGPESIGDFLRGWCATEAPDSDPQTGNLGDIYYFDRGNKLDDRNKWRLYWFEIADDGCSLFPQGWSSDPNWPSDWKHSLLPNLGPLAVSIIDNTPKILGWADETLSPLTFSIPTQKPKSIESLVGASYYALFKAGIHFSLLPENTKPSFNAFNKLARGLDREPLPILANWPLTTIDINYHTLKKLPGPPQINWSHRFKHIHNCPFLPPKYSQLIYWITTGTLKSGQWLNRIRRPGLSGNCPHCYLPPNPNCHDTPPQRAPASPVHMFWSCPSVQQVWTEADQLGHTFWADYTDFNYLKDITILTHEYNPITLFKLAVVWSLWRYWCEIFYQPDQFSPDRYTVMVPEIMLMVRDELLHRLTESRAVIQWLQIVLDRRTEPASKKVPEKRFLLVDSQAVKTNPTEYDLPLNNPLTQAWLGNNVLCYMRHKKLAFNHSNWYVYKDQLAYAAAPPFADPDSDCDPDDSLMPGRAAAFMTMDY